MPRISQIHRHGRKKPEVKKSGGMWHHPQLSGVCTKVGCMTPKKPNSAQRKFARVRLSNGITVTAYIRGEGHNLQEHSSVLVEGMCRNDLIGARRGIIRNTRDTQAVKDRKRGRSKYGAPKPKA